MEPVRFADILFILLVTAVTSGILYLVNRKPKKTEKSTSETAETTSKSVPNDKISTPAEDN